MQEAFIEKDGYQCGFCTPGFLMTTTAFLEKNPAPSRDEIKQALSGNLCRCGNYAKIYDAVGAAAKSRRGPEMRGKAYTLLRPRRRGTAGPAGQGRAGPTRRAEAASRRSRPSGSHRQADAARRRPRDRHRAGPVHARRQAPRHAHRQDPALAARRGRSRFDRPRPGAGRARGQGRPEARRGQGPLRRPAGRGRGGRRREDGREGPGPDQGRVQDASLRRRLGEGPRRGRPAGAGRQAQRRQALRVRPGRRRKGLRRGRRRRRAHLPDRLRGPPPDRDARQRRRVGGRPPRRLRLDPEHPRRPRRPGPGPQGPGGQRHRHQELHGRRLRQQARHWASTRSSRPTWPASAGRPVKVLLSRRDNAMCVGYRPSSHQTYKVGAKKDGTLTAFSLLNYASGGIVPGDEVAEPVVDLYRCPHCKVEEHTVFTNTGAQRAMRAPGHTPGAFGLESLMDELAAALDMDPLELRRKNYSTKNLGDTGLPYSSKGLDRCYEAGAKAIGWERRNRRPGEAGDRARRVRCGGDRHGLEPLVRGRGARDAAPTSSSIPTCRSRSSAAPRTSAPARGPTWPSSRPRRSGSSRRRSRSSSAIPTIPGRRSRAAA
ncbi:MAG: molybdopterin-dependent oxidoreductase [Anaerotruncus sp.]|nr:molybdopterin-dependent oxidoreductase [Anaerotruncus sp.]